MSAIGRRPGATRTVLATGFTTGTVIMIAAYIYGIRAPWPGLSPILGALSGALAEWVVAVAAATVGVELLRRHHRALAASAWQMARARGSSLTGRLAGWAGPRWQRRWAPPPAAIAVPAAAPAAAVTSRNGETPMPATAPAAPPMPPTRRPANLPAPSALWRAVAAAAADFVPESEAEAADWLRGQAAGLLAYAEGLMGAHANAVDEVGVNPVALRALHNAADTVAEAGATVGDGANDLLAYFAEVREFVQAGKQMTHDGRWITGEGD